MAKKASKSAVTRKPLPVASEAKIKSMGIKLKVVDPAKAFRSEKRQMKFFKAPSEFTHLDYSDHPAIPLTGPMAEGFRRLRSAGFELVDIDEKRRNCGDTVIMTVPEKLEGFHLQLALHAIAKLKPDEMDFYNIDGLDDRSKFVRLWWD